MQVISSWTGGQADALRQSLRMTNESFADHLGIGVRTVAYWRKRADVTPQPRMQEVLDTALERAPDRAKAQFTLLVSQAYHASAGQPDNTKQFAAASDISKGEIALWRPAGVDIDDAFNPDDEERLILAARHPRRSDPGVVDALSRVLSGQRRTEDSIGSALLIEPVKAQLAVVSDLVTEARGDLRTNVLDIGSQWAQFSGWLHASTGQLGEANRLYDLALEWALEADKPNMIATALSMQGHAAWLGAKAGSMIGLSRAAQRDNRASPGVRALAVQQEARGIALAGEAEIADIDRKFDRAEELAAQAAEAPEDEPPWIYFFSPDYLILQRGLAYRLAGDYAKANELLTAGLSAIPSDMRKADWVASRYLLQLAVNHAKSGDVDAACALAQEINIIARQTYSESLRAAVTSFHKRLSQKWPDNPHVAELGEAIR
jgi:tetratricopeptide (TPR) repeat protein